MNLGQLRTITEDLPDNTQVWVLASAGWIQPIRVDIETQETKFIEKDVIEPETTKLAKRVELRIRLEGGTT